MLEKFKSNTWFSLLLCFISISQLTTAAPTAKLLKQSLFDVALTKCHNLEKLNLTEKPIITVKCNQWSKINATTEFLNGTIENVQCLFYYESLVKFCTGLGDGLLNSKISSNVDMDKISFENICLGNSPLLNKSFDHQVLNKIGNFVNCMQLCMSPSDPMKPATICKYAYYYSTLNISVLNSNNENKLESSIPNFVQNNKQIDVKQQPLIPDEQQQLIDPSLPQESKTILTEEKDIKAVKVTEVTNKPVPSAIEIIPNESKTLSKETIRIAPGEEIVDTEKVKDLAEGQNDIRKVAEEAVAAVPAQPKAKENKKSEVVDLKTDGEKKLIQPQSVKNDQPNADAVKPNPDEGEQNVISEAEEEREWSENNDDPILDNNNQPAKSPVKPNTVENVADNNYNSNDIDGGDDDMNGNSYFFFYFSILICIVIVGYIGYHNRQKVVALMLEGKRSRRQTRTRRPNSANYHKLDSNLEEAISSSCTKSSSNVIY